MTEQTASTGAPALPKAPDSHRSMIGPSFSMFRALIRRSTRSLPDTEAQESLPWSAGPAPIRCYSNDANDPGGRTEEGIIQREYDLKRKHDTDAGSYLVDKVIVFPHEPISHSTTDIAFMGKRYLVEAPQAIVVFG